jgi:hypothetical protein
MLPSAVNDTMRDMMAQIRDCGDGIRDGTYTMTAPKITGGTITGATVTSNTFSSSGATITGGTINNTAIGGTTAAAGKFTTLEATGVTTVQAGTVSAPAITTTGDTNTGIFFPAADTIAFAEGGAEAMRIDSSGQVGIGVSSPSATLDVSKSQAAATAINALNDNASGSARIRVGFNTSNCYDIFRVGNSADIIQNATQATANIIWQNAGTERMRITSTGDVGIGTSSPSHRLNVRGVTNTDVQVRIQANASNDYNSILSFGDNVDDSGLILYSNFSNHMRFDTNSSERMRIDSSGNLLVGTTTTKTKLTVQGQVSFGATDASTDNGIYLYVNNALSDNSFMTRGSKGSGTTTWYIGNQTITTSSDVRLKNNIKPTERNALDLLNQWEIVDHTWNDPSDKCANNKNSRGTWTGVIAQQVQPITPWLVNKPTEDVDPIDGSINPWVMDFGYAVPLLVKAIQELNAKVVELEAKLNAK